MLIRFLIRDWLANYRPQLLLLINRWIPFNGHYLLFISLFYWLLLLLLMFQPIATNFSGGDRFPIYWLVWFIIWLQWLFTANKFLRKWWLFTVDYSLLMFNYKRVKPYEIMNSIEHVFIPKMMEMINQSNSSISSSKSLW